MYRKKKSTKTKIVNNHQLGDFALTHEQAAGLSAKETNWKCLTVPERQMEEKGKTL